MQRWAQIHDRVLISKYWRPLMSHQGCDIRVWRWRKCKAVCWVSCVTCWSWSLDRVLHSERQCGSWYLNSTFPSRHDLPGECTQVGGKEYLLCLPMSQRPCGDLHKTTLLPDCLESYKTPWFNWEMCVSTQAARKGTHFHATLTRILSTHESSSHAHGRPKRGNITENHGKSKPSPASPACTHPHTFECRIFCRY